MIELTNFTFPLIIGYAELHYHLKYLYPKYFIKQPEIIADCPIRVIKTSKNILPILIIIKDSHKFPIRLNFCKIIINPLGKSGEKIFEKNIDICQDYYSEVLEFKLDDIKSNEMLQVVVEINFDCAGKNYTIIKDNFPGLDKKPFTCYYAKKNLPYPKDWYAGDPHYHSNYTSDQVEFGADIKSTKILAKAMGLHWFFVTDHSYDLDDRLDNYTKNDPSFPKWEIMKNDCREQDEKNFRVVHGEEVSIGNKFGKNVHLLVINRDEFIVGSGDSAEVWFRNKPENLISDLPSETKNNLYIAAHPNDLIPFMQKLTLRRGSWHAEDFIDNNIKYMQVINSAEIVEIEKSIEYWKRLLLQKQKIYLIAGNDAHGNFNVMRQISKPFTKLFSSYKQTFGKMHTVFHYKNNDPVAGIKKGEMIVSNGPFINFWLEAESGITNIGESIKAKVAKLSYETLSTKEFGEIEEVRLFFGRKSGEVEIKDFINGSTISLENGIYIRMSVTTSNKSLAFTNPIFIDL